MSTKKLIDRLSIIFLLLFFILSISVSLYAAGYRFNWHWPLRFDQILKRTGMLIVETSPSQADIYLERDTGGLFIQKEFKQDYQSPAKIHNLLPGKYDIVLEKDGYWPLTRQINILPNQTTHLTNIFLFKRSLPLNIYSGEAETIKISPNKDKVILLDSGQVLSLKEESLIALEDYSKSSSIQYLAADRLLNNDKIYDLKSGQILIDLSPYLTEDYNKLYFEANNNRIFYLTENKLSFLTINKKTTNNILATANYLDFLVKGNNLHLIERNGKNTYLITYSLPAGLRQRSVPLPNGNYHFQFPNHPLLNLYDKEQKRLILIDSSPWLTKQKVINQVHDWQWSDHQLIWRNDREIYHYNSLSGEKKLLIRLSQEISGLSWHGEKNYLIYSTNQAIKIVYFRDNKIDIINLLEANNIHSLFLEEKEALLYFFADLDKQSGIFKLLIE